MKDPEDFPMASSGLRRRGVCQNCFDTAEAEKRERIERRRRTWVDPDTGRTVRLCNKCGKTKDLVDDFYAQRADPTVLSDYQYHCKPCQIKHVGELARARLDDPARAEDERARRRDWQRDWRERNPEKYLAAQKTWRRKMLADPEKHRAHLESARLSYHLRRRRRGFVSRPRATARTARTIPRVPVAPLAEFVMGLVAKETYRLNGNATAVVCGRIGIDERQLRAWRLEYDRVTFDAADRVLVNADALWWEVWRPCPDHAARDEDCSTCDAYELARAAWEGPNEGDV